MPKDSLLPGLERGGGDARRRSLQSPKRRSVLGGFDQAQVVGAERQQEAEQTQQAGDNAKAIALLTGAMQRGQLTDAKAYRSLYVTQINAGKLQDALATIDNGIAKGVIKPNEELVSDYSFIAQNAYADNNSALAIDVYKRAAAISSTGDPLLNIAVILNNDGKLAEAADYARQALAKGVKNKATAENILKAAGGNKKKK